MRRIYSIAGGMGSIGLCALRVAVREPCGRHGRGVILRPYGTAEAVP
jgi:hypothetical protein